MGRGVIDLPMDVIIQYLESHEHRKEWDRYLVVSSILWLVWVGLKVKLWVGILAEDHVVLIDVCMYSALLCLC